jgi:uncharacterized membrane protein YhaH (DUF805 family)
VDFLKGRTNRATYWAGMATLAVVYTLAWMFLGPTPVHDIVLVFMAVPRLHDLGRSGWWVVPVLAIEWVGAFVLAAALSPEVFPIAAGLIAIAVFGALAVLGALPGQRDANRFGAPPRRGIQLTATKAKGA